MFNTFYYILQVSDFTSMRTNFSLYIIELYIILGLDRPTDRC